MRPARPLIIGPSKRSVTAAEPAETARSGRPKRPRPQIVKLQRGASEAPPTTRPLAPTRPRQRWFDDPKNQRNALILGGLVIVGVVISALMMPGGDKSHGKPAAGSTQHPVDLGPTGANRVVIEPMSRRRRGALRCGSTGACAGPRRSTSSWPRALTASA
jgi:hypothetical protein